MGDLDKNTTEYQEFLKFKKERQKRDIEQLKAGTADQILVNAAYYGNVDYSGTEDWLYTMGDAMNNYFEAKETRLAAREKRRNASKDSLNVHATNIETSGGALGTSYFNPAFDMVNKLKEQYADAADGIVDGKKVSKDEANRKMAELKMELSSFSTYIQTLKGAHLKRAESYNGGLVADLTDRQLNIVESCLNEENAVYIDVDGDGKKEFVWKNDKFDIRNKLAQFKEKHPELDEAWWDDEALIAENEEFHKFLQEGDDRQYFTEKDLDGAMPIADDEVGTQVIDGENTKRQDGENFHINGKGEGFDEISTRHNHENRVTDKNIQYFLRDNFTGDGSFKDTFGMREEFQEKDFDMFFSIVNNPNASSSIKELLVKMDSYGEDGKLTIEDFIYTEIQIEKWESDGFEDPTPNDGKITRDDIIKLISNDGDAMKYTGKTAVELENHLRDIAFEKIRNAVINPDHDSFNYDVSKTLVVDWFTNRDKIAYYGNGKYTIENMMKKGVWPDEDGIMVDENGVEHNIQDLTLEQYTERGGSIGMLNKEAGWWWNEEKISYKGPEGKYLTEEEYKELDKYIGGERKRNIYTKIEGGWDQHTKTMTSLKKPGSLNPK